MIKKESNCKSLSKKDSISPKFNKKSEHLLFEFTSTGMCKGVNVFSTLAVNPNCMHTSAQFYIYNFFKALPESFDTMIIIAFWVHQYYFRLQYNIMRSHN